MYELSLIGFVEDKDVPSSLSILAGVCAQTPWESIHHVHFYRGPGRPSGMANQFPTPTPHQKDVPALWKELDRALSRQSYHIQIRHEAPRSRFGSALPTDLDAEPAILRWADFPEPPQAVSGLEKGAVTQRKKIEIWGQKGLHSLVKGKGYTLTSDQVEQAYLFFRGDIEICLRRLMNPVPLDQRDPAGGPSNPLPPWKAISNVDELSQWMLEVKIHVLQDNKPDEVREAQEQLAALKSELEGVFHFEVIERQFLDSRVPLEVQAAPAPLPQVVRAGD